MSLEDEFAGTRIGRDATYRCQSDLHEYGLDHRCSDCGAVEPRVRPVLGRTISGSIVLENLDELARWYQLEPHKFIARILLESNLTGHFAKGLLLFHQEVTADLIEEILMK